MKTKNILAFIGIGLVMLGGYVWMLGLISIAMILWGLTFLIILRINRINKNREKYQYKFKNKNKQINSKDKDL